MKSKGTLTLVELSIMLLVFALAAAFCMRAFVWASEASQEYNERDQALLQVQSVAETLKAYDGDMDEAALCFGGTWNAEVWAVLYNERWEQVDEFGTYELVVAPLQSTSDLIGMAEIRVLYDDVCLLQMEVAWQEVIPDA